MIPSRKCGMKFRNRLGEEGFREVFHELIKLAKEQGYTKGKLKAIDATHIFSDTPKLRPIALIKQGMRKILNKVKKANKTVACNLSRKYRECLKKAMGRGTEEIEKVRRDALRFVRDVRAKLGESPDILLDVLEKVAMGNSLKLVSFTDLDARWGKKSPKKSFGGYKVHTICETENGLVTSIDVLPGNANEGVYLPKLVEEEKSRGLEIKGIVADRDDMIIADSAEPKSIQEIRGAGFNIHACQKGADSIRNGINTVRSLRVHITKDSTNLIKEKRSYKWKEDKDGNVLDQPVKFHDHLMDAERYAIQKVRGLVEAGVSFLDMEEEKKEADPIFDEELWLTT